MTRRYALDEIPKTVYDQVGTELQSDRDAVVNQLDVIEDISSNLPVFLDDAMNLPKSTESMESMERRKPRGKKRHSKSGFSTRFDME